VVVGLLGFSSAQSDAWFDSGSQGNLATIQYPSPLQTVPYDPVKLVVQLEPGADPKTFTAHLNGKKITDAFEYDALKHKMVAIVDEADGLKFKRPKGRWGAGWQDRNLLTTTVKASPKPAKWWTWHKGAKSMDVDTRQFYVVDSPALTCTDLAALALPDVTINSVQEMAATATIPEHCRVLGTLDEEVRFEVRLPKNWNGKFYMGGGGGFVGSIQSQGWENAVAKGYATAGTDTGHKGLHSIDGSPFLNRPDRIVNWAYRAIHMTAVHAKLIIRAFYGSDISYSYFSGCSTGGRQAMMESQRYPNDFDGIIVGAPAYRYGPDLINYIQQAMFPPGQPLNQPVLPNAKLPLIAQAVLDNCDALDGVVDGLIEDPRNCTFNHWDLQCENDIDPGNNSCLTSTELKVLDRIYGDFVYTNGEAYPSYPVGCESAPGGWDTWITYSPAVLAGYKIPNLQYGFQQDILRYMVHNDASYDFHNYDPLNAYDDPTLLALYDITRAVNPDLSAFKGRGGKMIMYNGWADPILSALGTIVYYDQVESLDPNLRDYMRLFLLPGMLHCSGGPGPNVADFLSALENWVEQGIAPESILAAHYTGSVVDRTRPLCPYPKVARYMGSGSIDSAASFECVDPQPFDTLVETKYGKLNGYVKGDAVVWKGVPYAKPPVDALRWKAAEDPEPWDGIRDATSAAKKCTQLLTTKEWIRTGVVDPNSCEDCLYVDIYRPQHQRKVPVYVWIHGGSNNFGSARDYDGSVIAARSDVVVVVVQYRLGPIGWFYHPAIQSGGADALSDSGNFGTTDHAQVLRWIRENIGAFGGDSRNVTITGESAGAHNVMNMVVSPLANGLFHRAMSQSGGMIPVTAAAARASANDFIEKLLMYKDNVVPPVSTDTRALYAQTRAGMENDGTLESYLRATDAGTLFLALLKYGSVPTFPAIEDGTVMPAGGWMATIKSGNHNKVPIILGSNEYESKSFMPLYAAYVKPLGAPSGSYTWFNLINVLRGDLPLTLDDVLPTPRDKDFYELTGYYGSRNWKAKFVDTVAHELAKVQDNVYAYLFKWGGIGSGPSPFDFIYGAGHAAEIPFFFGDEQGLFGYPFVPENEAGRKDLQDAMMRYLARFARTGNPNDPSSLPPWQRWSNVPGAPKSMVFDADDDQADVSMMSEELTLEGVTADFDAAMTAMGLTASEKAAARIFQFSKPW
jgi:para-nitrobenzyl esterase